jgi:hypothetical protein
MEKETKNKKRGEMIRGRRRNRTRKKINNNERKDKNKV